MPRSVFEGRRPELNIAAVEAVFISDGLKQFLFSECDSQPFIKSVKLLTTYIILTGGERLWKETMTENLHLIHMLFSREVVLRGVLRGQKDMYCQ